MLRTVTFMVSRGVSAPQQQVKRSVLIRIRQTKGDSLWQPFSRFSTTNSTDHSSRFTTQLESANKSWDALKERLVDLSVYPPGSFHSEQWNEAQEAFEALKPLLNNSDNSDAVAGAFELFDRLCLELKAATRRDKKTIQLPLPVEMLDLAVNAWRQSQLISSSDDNDALKPVFSAHEVTSKVEDYVAAGLFSPNVKIYNMIMDTIGRTEDPARAVVLAEALLQKMMEKNEDEVHPDAVTINTIIYLWSKSGQRNAPDMVEAHLERLKQWYKQSGREDLKPNSHMYTSVIGTWIRSDRQDAALHADKLLKEMRDTQESTDDVGLLYQTVITALAKSGRAGTANRAHSRLNEMLQMYDNGETAVKPDVMTFPLTMVACAKAEKAELTEGLLKEMETRYEQTGDPDFCPDVVCYNAMIAAFARNGQPLRAGAVLQRMLNLSKSGKNEHAKPDAVSWTSVLQAWANSRDPTAAEQASEIFDVINALYKGGDKLLQPDVRMYTSLLSCFAKSPHPQKYVDRAEVLLDWMEKQESVHLKPDEIIYLVCMTICQKANEPERAEAILKSMYAKYRSRSSSAVPNNFHFSTVIAAWAKSNNPRAPERAERLLLVMHELHVKEGLDIRPDKVTMNALIDCFARSKRSDAPDQAERFLRLMQEQVKAGNQRAEPDVVSYTSVISTWARSYKQDACCHAEDLLREMIEHNIKPNLRTYTAVITAFARHGRPDKAEAIFREMTQNPKAPRPNRSTYVALLQAWAKAGEPERTESVLQEMIREYEAGNINEKPTAQSFTTVLQAWLRSGRYDAAEQAEKGLNDMHELAASGRFDCHPDDFTYSCVISAYAQSSVPDAAERALNLLKRLQGLNLERGDTSCHIPVVIYSEVLFTLARTSDSSWSQAINEVIQDLERVDRREWVNPKRCFGLYKAIETLANSSIPEKEHLVQRLQHLMEQHGMKPNSSAQ